MKNNNLLLGRSPRYVQFMLEEKIANNKKKCKAAKGSQPNIHFIFGSSNSGLGISAGISPGIGIG